MNLSLASDKLMSFALAALAIYAAALVPADAFAQTVVVSGSIGSGSSGGSPLAIQGILCAVVGWFTGPIGKGIATLAIIVVGIGALMGKVSWGMAIIVGIGVGVVFGAKELVNLLASSAGGGGSNC